MSLRRATGSAAFAGDVALPGMLHLALQRSPHACARVVRADATAARSLPGVVAVLTFEDAPRVLPDVVSFLGDRVVLTAAEEPELARRAAERVDVAFEVLPAVSDAEAAQLDETRVAARVSASEGDVDGALAGAERVVEGEWRLPFSPAISLEPPLAVTWLDEDRRLVVRTSAESPFRVRGALAERLGVPAARIRVVRPLVAGGALGRANVAVEDVCALVTLRTGRPARLALSLEEAFALTPGRPPQRVRLRLALGGGRLLALDVKLLVDLGSDGDGASALLRAAGRHGLGLYRIPGIRFEAIAVRTNHPPRCAPRGGDAGVGFALECALDEAARLLGEDPAALRRRHLRRPGDAGAAVLAELGEPEAGDDARPIAELLRNAAERVGAAVPGSGPLRQASGLAVARRASSTGGHSGAAALRLLDDGSFTLVSGPPAAGGVDELTYAEAAAAILGVPARRVVCAATDTDTAPYLSGDEAPTASAAGHAVEQAARAARERIREAGASLLGVPVAETALDEGYVRDSSGRRVSFAEIGAAALRAGQPLVVTATPGPAVAPQSLAAAFADVEVDIETGGVRLQRLAAAVAGGPFSDPRPAEAQVEGALAAALEQALAAGTGGLVAAVDVPPLAVRFVPAGDPLSRFSATVHGEAAGRAAVAAIANAVARATSARIRALPLAPALILAALDEPLLR